MKPSATVAIGQQLEHLIKLKPEADKQVKYYESVIRSSAALIEGIEQRINSKRAGDIALDAYDIAKLEKEKLHVDLELFANKNYFQEWLKLSVDHDKIVKEVTEDCEANFIDIYAQAVEIAKIDKTFEEKFVRYVNPDNIQSLKNEFYLFIKNRVELSQKKAGLHKV